MLKKFLVAGTAISMLVSTPAFAEWRVAESENFQVISEEKPEEMMKLAAKLERLKMVMTAFSGVKKERPGKKLKVYWVNNAYKIQQLIKGGGGYIQGYYVAATPYGPIAVTPGKKMLSGRKQVGGNDQDGIDPEIVLFHEYGHHFMLQNFPVAYPQWFVEGFAEYYGYTGFEENGDIKLGDYATIRRDEFRYLGLMNMKKLLDNTPKPPNTSFYGTSWLLTHYLQFNPERRKERDAYLADVQAGMESVAAAEKNFKGGVKGLEKDLKKYLSGHTFPVQTLGGIRQIGTEDIKLSSLPADRASAMTEEIRFYTGFADDKDERRKLLSSVAAISKANLGSAHLKAFLADVQYQNDEDDVAIATASEALALQPDHQRARLVKAAALMEKAQTLEGGNTKNKEPEKPSDKPKEGAVPEDLIVVTATRTKDSIPLWAEARKLIIASNRADPEDPYPLYLYYEYLKRRGEQISEAATDGLAKAHMLIPQYSPTRFALAEEYSDQGDHVSAANVIKPEAFSPHGSEDRRKARAVLKRYECLAADPKAECVFKEKTAEEEKKEEEATT
jgi:tetratricopeptide (TPR) repeat protein